MYGTVPKIVCMTVDERGDAGSRPQAYHNLTIPPHPKCSLPEGPSPFLQNLCNSELGEQHILISLAHFQGCLELEQMQVISCHEVNDHIVGMLLC